MKQFYTPQQVAAMLQVELPYVYGMIRSKQLKAFDILPGLVRVSSEAVDDFVQARSAQDIHSYQMPQEFRKLSHRAQNILERLSMFHSVEDLTQYSKAEWMRFRGVGALTLNEIDNLCRAHGYQMRDE